MKDKKAIERTQLPLTRCCDVTKRISAVPVLSGPSGEAPKMVAHVNKGFTQEELAYIQNKELPLRADIFLQTLKCPSPKIYYFLI